MLGDKDWSKMWGGLENKSIRVQSTDKRGAGLEFGQASSHCWLHRQGLDHVPPALTTLPGICFVVWAIVACLCAGRGGGLLSTGYLEHLGSEGCSPGMTGPRAPDRSCCPEHLLAVPTTR